MTEYVFHYDLEDPDLCIKATPRLVALHMRYEVPATFFMLGRTLEIHATDLRRIIPDDPLFDIQSHTYSHRMLKDNRVYGPGLELSELRHEISRGLEVVEAVFDRQCIGVRSGCGFFKGLRGEPQRLSVLTDCGVEFLSSDLRGPGDSIPGGLTQAYWYEEEGVGELLELPGHGWHDNVLKGFDTGLHLSWPPVVGWGIPTRPPCTPEEELLVQREWIERASQLNLDYVSPVYHPHSIYRMSEDCRTIEILMQYLRTAGMQATTYSALYDRYLSAPDSVPGPNAWSWDEEERSTETQPFVAGFKDMSNDVKAAT
jgi:polysaccharide deacetylase